MASVVFRIQQRPFPEPSVVVEVERDGLFQHLWEAIRIEYELADWPNAEVALYLSGALHDVRTQVVGPNGTVPDRDVFVGATWALLHEFAVATEFEVLLTELRPDARVGGYAVRERRGDWSFQEESADFTLAPAHLDALERRDAGALRDVLAAIPGQKAFFAIPPEAREAIEELLLGALDGYEDLRDWPSWATLAAAWHRAAFDGPPLELSASVTARLLSEAKRFSAYLDALQSNASRLPEWPSDPSELLVTIESALAAASTPQALHSLGQLLSLDVAEWFHLSAVFLAAQPHADRADAAVEKMVAFSGDPMLWVEYALGHTHSGRADRARAALGRVIALEPAISRKVRRKIPAVLSALRDFNAAEGRLRSLLAEPSLDVVDRTVAALELARLLRETGREAEGDALLRAESARATEERRAMGGTFQRTADEKRRKPNDPCACGSGKKAKRCHGVDFQKSS